MAATLRVRLVSTRTSPTLAWPKMDSLHYLGDTGRGNTFLSATAVRAADIASTTTGSPIQTRARTPPTEAATSLSTETRAWLAT